MSGGCTGRMRGGRVEALVEALAKFDIAGDVSSLLDKAIQGVFLHQVRNQPLMDHSVKTMEVMASDPGVGFIGLVSKLVDKHLEFHRIFICSSLSSLTDGLGAFNDVGLAVGCQVLFFEGLDECFERGERFD